jgi:hypothetical protein
MGGASGMASVARLRDCLVSEDGDLRRGALIASRDRGFDPDLFAGVVANLSDPDPQIRSRALDVIDRWMSQSQTSLHRSRSLLRGARDEAGGHDAEVAEAAAPISATRTWPGPRTPLGSSTHGSGA